MAHLASLLIEIGALVLAREVMDGDALGAEWAAAAGGSAVVFFSVLFFFLACPDVWEMQRCTATVAGAWRVESLIGLLALGYLPGETMGRPYLKQGETNVEEV